MNKKQRTKVCRIKVERLAKAITAICVILIVSLVKFCGLDGYIGFLISTVIWFIMPDISAYLLENHYKIKHNFMNYR